jgi:hypothetical protein
MKAQIFLVLTLTAALALASACGSRSSANANAAAPQPTPVDVTTDQAAVVPIPSYIEATGSLASDAQSDVAPAVAGKIVEVNFDVGSYVNQGSVLIRLDPRDAQIRLVDGDGTKLVASFGTHPAPEYIANSQRTPSARAFLERQPVHVHDLRAEVSEYSGSQAIIDRTGTRTFLAVPMLREGFPIGLINIGEPKFVHFRGK